MTARIINKLFVAVGLACLILAAFKANIAHKFWLVGGEYELHLSLETVMCLILGFVMAAYNSICIVLLEPSKVADGKRQEARNFDGLKVQKSRKCVPSQMHESSC